MRRLVGSLEDECIASQGTGSEGSGNVAKENSTQVRYKVKCAGCGTKVLERDMRIYDAPNDAYFCKLACKDSYRRKVDGE